MRRVTSFTIVAVTIAMLAALAPGATAFAIGPGTFVIPAGSTAKFTDIHSSACNSLSWGYQLNGINVPQATFAPGCVDQTAPDVTIGPFPAPVTFLVFMTDDTCGAIYYSDGTPVDHVIVDGTDPFTVRFADAGFGCTRTDATTNDFAACNLCVTVAITDRAITAAGTTISATEGKSFTAPVATFTDPDTAATANDYSATISWGDGGSSAGTITGGSGSFSVSGSHTYSEEGSHTVTVTITDADNAPNTAAATSTAKVADATLTASAACSPTSLQSYNSATATFTDAASPSGTLSDFSASIDWGDGTITTGTVSGANGGPYTVSGSHTYASTGIFTITTTITDVGGSTATTSCNTLGFSFAPGGGSFVIGDKNAALGGSVTFWGAQWAKDNSLSGSSTPRNFKGFAESPTTPACGTGWTADPGNSTPPPDGPLPTFMAVIVTSSADQSGSTTSGNTVHIVIVKTDPGYAADAGHAGTGRVVAVVC